jgi:hypothetical protein
MKLKFKGAIYLLRLSLHVYILTKYVTYYKTKIEKQLKCPYVN